MYYEIPGAKLAPDLIDKAAVAQLLSDSQRTVDRYRGRTLDPLPYIRLSKRCIRFDRNAVLAWVQRQNVGGLV